MPRGIRLTEVLLASTVVLSGCTLPLVGESSPPGIPPASVAGLGGSELVPPPDLLKYYDWLREQPAEGQRQEYDVSRTNFDAEPNTLNRLRLALVLCIPGSPFRDYGAARALLTEYLEDAAGERPENRGLAYLILGFVEQNARAQRQRYAAQKQLKESRELTEGLEGQVQDLEIKVEQLKAIEEDLMETEQSINVPAQPATSDD